MVTTYFCGFVHARWTVIHWSYVTFPLRPLVQLANCLFFHLLHLLQFLFISYVKNGTLCISLSMHLSLGFPRSFPIFFSVSLTRYQSSLSLLSSYSLFLKLFKSSCFGRYTLSESVHPDLTSSLLIHGRSPSHHLHVLQGSPDSI